MKQPPLPGRPDLVLFDLDDTLCDYAGARARRLQHAFTLAAEESGVTLPNDLAPIVAESIAMAPHSTEHFAELLARYGIADDAAIAAARGWFGQNRFHTLALFPEAVETVTAVRQSVPGRRIGIVTNGPSDVQRAKIALFAVEPYLDFILVSEEFGAWKPEPAIFAEALRLGDATPDQTVFIGDSAEHDMVGALAAGIAAIWVNPTGRPWDQPSPPPTRIVTCLAEVRELLA